MTSSWDDLRATLASLADAFGNQAVKSSRPRATWAPAPRARLGDAIAGEPRGSGRRAAEVAWARLQDGVGWTTPAWRECYVLGQLREATEAGEDAAAAASAEKGTEGDDGEGTRGALLRRAMLAVDMAHIMGGPGEIVQRFGRAIEAIIREDRADAEVAGDAALIPDVLPPRAAVTIDPEHALERAEGITAKSSSATISMPISRVPRQPRRVVAGAGEVARPPLAGSRARSRVPLEVGAYDARRTEGRR